MTVADPNLDPGTSTGDSNAPDPSLSKDTNTQWTPPTDGSWIPRERLNSLTDKISKLEDKLNAAEEQNAPKPIPRSEMLAKVDSGDITLAEADKVWEDQIETKILKNVSKVAENTSVENRIQDQLSEYESSVPELGDATSELYTRVAKELQYLVGNGLSNNGATTLAAVRSVVGPIGALKHVVTKDIPNDPHLEISSSGDNGQGSKASDKIILTPRQKDYYGNAIRMGAYPNWNAVHEELKGYQK